MAFFLLEILSILLWIICLGMPTFIVENEHDQLMFIVQGWFAETATVFKVHTGPLEDA